MREVLDRLGVKLGDRIIVGELTYELRAVIEREPDRGAGAFLLGPRLMVSRRSLAETGLIQPGSLIFASIASPTARASTTRPSAPSCDRRFPDAGWRLRGLDDASPGVKRWIDRTALFLTLVGLSALLIGGVGVGNAVKAFLESKPRPSRCSNAWAPRPGPSSPSISP